jgi:5-methylcytosine-specific restriction endonuclease McrA
MGVKIKERQARAKLREKLDRGLIPEGVPLEFWQSVYVDDQLWSRSDEEPVKVSVPWGAAWQGPWIYKDTRFDVSDCHDFPDEELKLLIRDALDKERKKIERLQSRYAGRERGFRRVGIAEDVRIYVWQRDGGACTGCGSNKDLEYDHIVPVSRGGSSTARNVQLLCERCNRTKGNNI